ncbi:hypothetical protein [Nonomuraea bangladeshensis]|uniref:hypothetical protein n=1 Tax=Nonomuraea bangladeshensis TaxID=404385 RepID=UPI003C30B236
MTAFGVITVAGFRPDGSALLQTWLLSDDDRAFVAGVLADRLGEPHSETLASAENVETVGGFVLDAPGAVTTYPREQP